MGFPFTTNACAHQKESLGSIMPSSSNLRTFVAMNFLSSFVWSLDFVTMGLLSGVKLENSEIGVTKAAATEHILRGGFLTLKFYFDRTMIF